MRPGCTDNRQGRSAHRHPEEHYLDLARARRGTTPYAKAMRKRKVWVEPLFSEAKRWHGLGRFRLRGLERVNTEALLVAAGQNVKRLLAFGGWGPKGQVEAAVMRPPVLANRKLHRLRRYRPGYHVSRRSPFCNTFRRYRA